MSSIDFTKGVLRIDPELIIDKSKTLEYWFYDYKDLHQAVALVNRFHSYFHFEQSNLCLLAAKIAALLKNDQMELAYLEKAVFQDHLNYEALVRLAKFSEIELPIHAKSGSYNSHIKYEADFLKFSIGDFLDCHKIKKLDQAILLYEKGGISEALELADDIDQELHRLILLKASINMHHKCFELALSQIDYALQLVESSHQAYHQTAAKVYQVRAQEYENKGFIELAKNDLIKASDLDPTIKPL